MDQEESDTHKVTNRQLLLSSLHQPYITKPKKKKRKKERRQKKKKKKKELGYPSARNYDTRCGGISLVTMATPFSMFSKLISLSASSSRL